MSRSKSSLAPILTPLLFVALLAIPFAASAQDAGVELTPEESAANKLGFYFAMSLDKLSHLGPANGIGVVTTAPAIEGGDVPIAGPEVDGDFRGRWSLGFKLGFRLRKNHGNVEARFFQWDQQQDLLHLAPDGKAIANTLASPSAGYSEDLGAFPYEGPPDGSVGGFEAGSASEGAAAPDPVADGAEDINYNGRPDFIRFLSSNRIVGELKTDYKTADVDYLRTIKKLGRLTLDGRVGVRVASLNQTTDLGYRQLGSFAVYKDDEGGQTTGPAYERTSNIAGSRGNSTVQDGDGDGERDPTQNEPDGDGFLDGNGNSVWKDSLDNVQTITEDRIVANMKTSGTGLVLGLDGRFELSKKWRLSGGIAVGGMHGKTEFRYRETFTSERDRYPNFIDWDFNHDGQYNMLDLDFDGSCNGIVEGCDRINNADQAVLPTDGTFTWVPIRQRLGVEYSYVSGRLSPATWPLGANPLGVNSNALFGPWANRLRVGDPVPESERNTDVLRETTLLNDISGSKSGISPTVDLDVGLEFQFSKFAHLDFGLRSTRWFGAGSFRALANQVIDGGPVSAGQGDLQLSGGYFTVTIVPR
jgi:hypothetical protein